MPTECFKDVGAPRLLELADILDVADKEHRARDEPVYRQSRWRHACGTPACALGHYSAHRPERVSWASGQLPEMERQILGLAGKYEHDYPIFRTANGALLTGCPAGAAEFCLEYSEALELFDSGGCGSALNGQQAATYIRNFVFRKLSCK